MLFPIEEDWVVLPPLPVPRKPVHLIQEQIQLTKTVIRRNVQERELVWFIRQLHDVLKGLKQGLEDCYALLAPVPPGSTLPVTTHRNELVKGHVTRVGTRLVKGTLYLHLRTLPPLALDINADSPVHLAPLEHLYTLLTHSIDLLTLTVSHAYPQDHIPDIRKPPTDNVPRSTAAFVADSPAALSAFLAAQLRLLAQSLGEAAALLRGGDASAPTPTSPTTSSPSSDPSLKIPTTLLTDPNWTSRTSSPIHYQHRQQRELHPPSNLSLYWGIQDSSLVLWIRNLEDADQPLHFGMKFALAIGTTRRLEHDEMEKGFEYTYPEGCEEIDDDGKEKKKFGGQEGGRRQGKVYVREKIRVETADPSLLSLSAKLLALGNTLDLARRNLAAVMGEDVED